MSKKNVAKHRRAQILLRAPAVQRRPAPEAHAIPTGAGPHGAARDVPAAPGAG